MPTLYDAKLEAMKQWNKNPCGALPMVDGVAQPLEYYRRVRSERYGAYAPWLQEAAGFQQFRERDVLEIGVGMGSDHLQFALGGNRLTALDLSQTHLDHTCRHLELEGYSTQPNLGDAERMPFPAASFDVVYSFGVLHHTPDFGAALKEVHRVLRPGGCTVIGVYHRNSIFFWSMVVGFEGLRKGQLFKKGLAGILSEVERRGSVDDATPLVRVYTRSQLQRIFGSLFREVRISTHHVEEESFWRLRPLVRGQSREQLERNWGRFGWYLLVHATK